MFPTWNPTQSQWYFPYLESNSVLVIWSLSGIQCNPSDMIPTYNSTESRWYDPYLESITMLVIWSLPRIQHNPSDIIPTCNSMQSQRYDPYLESNAIPVMRQAGGFPLPVFQKGHSWNSLADIRFLRVPATCRRPTKEYKYVDSNTVLKLSRHNHNRNIDNVSPHIKWIHKTTEHWRNIKHHVRPRKLFSASK